MQVDNLQAELGDTPVPIKMTLSDHSDRRVMTQRLLTFTGSRFVNMFTLRHQSMPRTGVPQAHPAGGESPPSKRAKMETALPDREAGNPDAQQLAGGARQHAQPRAQPDLADTCNTDSMRADALRMFADILDGAAPQHMTAEQALRLTETAVMCLADLVVSLLPCYFYPIIDTLPIDEV